MSAYSPYPFNTSAVLLVGYIIPYHADSTVLTSLVSIRISVFVILGTWWPICSGPDWYGVPGIPE